VNIASYGISLPVPGAQTRFDSPRPNAVKGRLGARWFSCIPQLNQHRANNQPFVLDLNGSVPARVRGESADFMLLLNNKIAGCVASHAQDTSRHAGPHKGMAEARLHFRWFEASFKSQPGEQISTPGVFMVL
jgi:hypothetical protein